MSDNPTPLGGSIGGAGFFQTMIRGWQEVTLPLLSIARSLQSLVTVLATLASNGAAVKISGSFSADGTLGSVPAGALIIGAVFEETAGHAVTVSLGTSSGGTQILGGTAVGASGIVPVNGSGMLLQVFAGSQPVFVHSPSWGGANLSISLWYVQ